MLNKSSLTLNFLNVQHANKINTSDKKREVMRKSIFVFISLLLVSNAALADWKRFGGNARSNAYYNPSSIIKDGSIVTVTSMSSFSSDISFGFKSSIISYKFNCESDLIAVGDMQMLSESMGRGKVVLSNHTQGKWSSVENSIDKEVEFQLFNLVCAKNK